MTITLTWWLVPIALALAGVGAWTWTRWRGYGAVGDLVGFSLAICGICSALGVVAGKLLL